MNNGQYVGPIISRKSPRWKTKESGIVGTAFAGGGTSAQPGLYEPYIPPTVAAVMVTASSGGYTGGGTQHYTGASCHNVVFPKSDRRLFVEITSTGAVYIYLVAEASAMATTSGQLSLAVCEHALLLQQTNIGGGLPNSAIAYSRNAAGYVTAGQSQVLPYLNGVIAGPNPLGANGVADSNSLIDTRLRSTGNLAANRTSPGNLFYPVRSIANADLATSGSGYRSHTMTAGNTGSAPYVRLEYLV